MSFKVTNFTNDKTVPGAKWCLLLSSAAERCRRQTKRPRHRHNGVGDSARRRQPTLTWSAQKSDFNTTEWRTQIYTSLLAYNLSLVSRFVIFENNDKQISGFFL